MVAFFFISAKKKKEDLKIRIEITQGDVATSASLNMDTHF
jgi:hypothetical protein